MVEVSLTVGKLDASLALLLTRDHHLIEFPTILLPDGISAGSIVKITCDRDLEREKKEQDEFEAVQNEIFSSFGLNSPKAPVLKIKNITQTSCVLEWDPLEVGTASIKSLTLYRNKSRLGQIPNPLSNTTSKLSGLAIEGAYTFQLRLDTTAGVYTSNELQVTTHKMTDLSGITVCLGEINFAAVPFTESDIEESLKKMGAKDLQHQVSVDTTHFVCTEPSGTQWESALKHNIPVVRPEWIKACELERRIIGVRMFYLDADPSYLRQRDFWKQSGVANNHAEVSASPEEDSRPDGNAASDDVSPNNVDDEVSEVVPEVGQMEDEVQAAAPEAVVAASDENAPSNVNDKESEEYKLDQKEEQLEAAPEEVVEDALPKEAVQDEQEKVALEEKVEGDNFEAAAHNDGASKDISESGEIHTEDHAAPEAAEQNDLPEESPAKLAQEALKEDIDEAAPQSKETAVDEFSERAQSEGAQLEESPLEEVESEGGQLEESPLEEAPLEEAPLEDVSLETAPLEDVPLEETSVDASVKEPLSESAAEEKLETIPRSESPGEEEPFEEDSNTVSQPQQNNKSKSKNKKNKNKKK